MTSDMMIKIMVIPPPDRTEGKSTKTFLDPSALGEAITGL